MMYTVEDEDGTEVSLHPTMEEALAKAGALAAVDREPYFVVAPDNPTYRTRAVWCCRPPEELPSRKTTQRG